MRHGIKADTVTEGILAQIMEEEQMMNDQC